MIKTMTDKYKLTALNKLSRSAFIDLLGSIYEHSAWVAEQAYQQRPFDSVQRLQHVMFDIVQASSIENRLSLIRNHPELAGKEADEGTLTADSQKEQSRAGLNQCTAQELEQLRRLNKDYQQKFSFPFVVAVSGLNKHQVMTAMQTRLQNEYDREFTTSIDEIGKIGRIRLDALLDE